MPHWSMFKLATHTVTVLTLAVSLAGCDSPADSFAPSDMDDVAVLFNKSPAQSASGATDPARVAAEPSTARGDESSDSAASEVSSDTPPDESASPAAPRTEAGRPTLEPGGYLTTIAGARRHILNRLDDLAWTQAVQHFQATEGRLPKDHAEFMTRIIEPLGIDLGYKEEDQEFLYDPNEGSWGAVYVVERQQSTAP